MIISKSLKYYRDKARIDKRNNKSTAYKIQFYNNNVIDDYIKNFNDAGAPSRPPDAMLYAELSILNKPQVYSNYNRIINSEYTSNDNLQKMIIRNKANKDLERVVEAELSRIVKNLDYVDYVMRNYKIPQKEYQRRLNAQRDKSLANRQEILKDVAIQANDLLVSEGLNIPSNVFSYRNLDITAETLMRQSQMKSEHDRVNAINDEAEAQGKDTVYNKKKWIWTGAGATTRHESNNMQERDLNEAFVVVNDKTLEIDEMMYPSDPAGSPSNSYICYCEVEYY